MVVRIYIYRAWENITENSKTSAKESLGVYELKLQKPQFHKEYLKFLDGRQQPKNAVVTGSKPKKCRQSKQCRT